jgi:hypothetical protein
VKDQSDEGMNAKDIFVFSTNTYFVLIPKRMADTGTLEAIPAVQSSLAEPTLRK